MKLPQQVKEAKEYLETTKDVRLKIICSMTEAKDSAYAEYLEKMWKNIFREEKKLGQTSNYEWVLQFVNAVASSMEEKPYYSMNGKERRESLKEIKKATKILKQLYRSLGLDQHFLLYDPQIFHLFDESGKQISEIDLLPTAGIIDVLDFYESYTKEEVGKYTVKGKLGTRHKSIRFIRALAQRNKSRYGQPLLSVLSDSAFAIYGERHDDMSNIVNGRTNKIA
jgi:hypothetical protein